MLNFFHSVISKIGVAVISVTMFFTGANSATPNAVPSTSVPVVAPTPQAQTVTSAPQVTAPKKEVVRPKPITVPISTPKPYVPPAVSSDTPSKQQTENPVVAPVQKSGYQICKDTYGNATWDGTSYTSSGGPNCSCDTGYSVSSDGKSCVAAPAVETGYQVCSTKYQNETWDGTYGSNGSYNCVCQTGYTYNSNVGYCLQTNSQQGQAQQPTYISVACQTAQQNLTTFEQQNHIGVTGDLTTGTSPVGGGNAMAAYNAASAQLLVLARVAQYACQ